jgi:hypothetical protein
VAAAALVPSLFAAEDSVTANHEIQQVSDSSRDQDDNSTFEAWEE